MPANLQPVRSPGGPPRRPELAVWSDECETLRRQIEWREIEASYARCDPLRAARMRQEVRVLAGRLEALKRSALASEQP